LKDRGERNIEIAFSRGGKSFVLKDAETDSELSEPLSRLERKLLRFRPLGDPDHNVCQH
jgi:hypothetical protein